MKYADIIAGLEAYAGQENSSSFVTFEKAKLARIVEYLKSCEVTEPKNARELVGELMESIGTAAVDFGRVAKRDNSMSCQYAVSKWFGVSCGDQKNCDACRAATLDSIYDSLRDIEAALKEDE